MLLPNLKAASKHPTIKIKQKYIDKVQSYVSAREMAGDYESSGSMGDRGYISPPPATMKKNDTCGKIAEFAMYDLLKRIETYSNEHKMEESIYNISEPDTSHHKNKSWAHDIKAKYKLPSRRFPGTWNFAVKSCILNENENSWLFNKSNYSKPGGEDSALKEPNLVCLFVIVSDDFKNAKLAFSAMMRDIVSNDLFKDPKLNNYIRTKRAVYLDDLRKKIPQQDVLSRYIDKSFNLDELHSLYGKVQLSEV